eukprot:gene27512-34239_t
MEEEQFRGQSARFQLRFLNKSIAPITQQPESEQPVEQTTSTPMEGVTASTDTTTVAAKEESYPTAVIVSRNETNQQNQQVTLSVDTFVSSTTTSSIIANITKQFSATAESPVKTSDSPKHKASKTEKHIDIAPIAPLKTSRELISDMLSQNFDSVTIPAVVTIAKYVMNILNNAQTALSGGDISKFLAINCSNKLFLEKVYVCKGAIELLYCVGFTANSDNSVLTLTARTSSTSSSDQGGVVDFPCLSSVFGELQAAMEELGVPEDQRPVLKNANTNFNVNNSSNSSSSSNVKVSFAPPAAPSFDPYKSSIVRTAPQPGRVESSTDRQLEALNRKREELEGSVGDVERNTEALFPNADGDTPAPPVDTNTPNEVNADTSSSGALPKSVVSKILSSSKPGGDDGPPLTTKAIRDLQKAQKERVYAKTLVRVRFPDRVVLQGHFHPRHTIAEVYQWVHAHLVDMGDVVGGGDIAADYSLFDLYVSPPRTVLTPFNATPSSKNSSSNTTSVTLTSSSLTDLRLVPAALIHLSWNENHPTVQTMRAAELIAGSSSKQSAGSGGEVGRYLIDSMRSAASSSGVSLYPTGASLVPSSTTASISSSGGSAKSSTNSSSSSSGGSSSSRGEEKKSSGKPKWFKT